MSNNQLTVKEVKNKNVKINVVKILKKVSNLVIISYCVLVLCNQNIVNNLCYQSIVSLNIAILFGTLMYEEQIKEENKSYIKLICRILFSILVFAIVFIVIGTTILKK